MATLGELLVRVNADISGLQRGLDNATSAIRRMNSDMAGLGRNLTLAVTVPIVALGASVTGAAAEMDSLTRGLNAVSGSANATREQLTRLEGVAKLPGLGFREAIRGSINLQAAGLSANTAERALKAFGNALATVGRGKADLDGVTRALTQIASKSKVSAEEINQLNERVPQIRQAMIAAFGSADTEVLGKMGIRSAQFIDAIIAQLEKLPPVTGGAANSFENLSDAMFRARAAIGEKLLPAVVPLVEGLANMLERVRTLNPETVRWGIAIASVAAVLGPLILVVSNLTTATLAFAAAIGVAGLAGTIATGGILLVLGTLSALFVKNKLDALNAAAAADTYRLSLIGLSESQLRSNRIAEMLRFQDAQLGRQALVDAHKNVETRVVAMGPAEAIRRRGIMIAPGLFAVRGATEDMRRLNIEARDAQGKITALDGALSALSRLPAGNAAAVPATIGAAAKHAGETVDALAGKLRDLAKAHIGASDLLKRTGLPFAPNVANTVSPGPLPVRDALALSGTARKTSEALGELTRQAKDAGVALKHNAEMIGASIKEGALQVASGSSQFLGNAISMGSKLAKAGQGMAAAGPAALAFAAAMEVVTGTFSVLGPAIDALTMPLRLMGEIVGLLLVPVLRILWQPLKLLGIVVSYIGEVIAKVAGAIAVAIGSLVRGIGRLVNKLPGSPGDPLVKAGNAMIDLGNQFKDAAKEMAKRRKELEGLSFEDAMEGTSRAADKLSESMLNAVQGFKIERFRFEALKAAESAIPASSVRAAQAPTEAPVTINGLSIPVNIVAHDADGRELYRALYSEMEAGARKHTKFRPIFYLFPQPA